MQGDPGSLDAGWSWITGCRVILDHWMQGGPGSLDAG